MRARQTGRNTGFAGFKAGSKDAAESRIEADMGLLGQTLCQLLKVLLNQ
jgi:hypothetical protein